MILLGGVAPVFGMGLSQVYALREPQEDLAVQRLADAMREAAPAPPFAPAAPLAIDAAGLEGGKPPLEDLGWGRRPGRKRVLHQLIRAPVLDEEAIRYIKALIDNLVHKDDEVRDLAQRALVRYAIEVPRYTLLRQELAIRIFVAYLTYGPYLDEVRRLLYQVRYLYPKSWYDRAVVHINAQTASDEGFFDRRPLQPSDQSWRGKAVSLTVGPGVLPAQEGTPWASRSWELEARYLSDLLGFLAVELLIEEGRNPLEMFWLLESVKKGEVEMLVNGHRQDVLEASFRSHDEVHLVLAEPAELAAGLEGVAAGWKGEEAVSKYLGSFP